MLLLSKHCNNANKIFAQVFALCPISFVSHDFEKGSDYLAIKMEMFCRDLHEATSEASHDICKEIIKTNFPS